jgi:cytochrome oxidase Cu insertion factor (SCO1/SenC/PrrC family)
MRTCMLVVLWFVVAVSVLVSCATPSAPAGATTAPAVKAPRMGDMAPDFTLTDSKGNNIHLAEELKTNRAVVLVFYHSYG